jgi:predicted dehydrogenase
MAPIRFGILGGGWRAEFFIRVAQALPDRFEVSRVMLRDPAKAQAFAARLKVETCTSIDDLVRGDAGQFVVLSVPCINHPQLLGDLADRKMPVLCETPAARDTPAMEAVYALTRRHLRAQIAEQLHLRPMHAARIDIARSGLLGNVTQAQVAVAHGYHGISLIRRLLGITFEDVTITARRSMSSIVAGPGRQGPPTAEATENVMQEIAWMDFGGKLGVFDFAGSQYFSYIRGTRMLVQGDRGEICNDELRYLQDFRTPIHTKLRREAAGEGDNLEGCYFKGIVAGDRWVYVNPYVPGRLSDDEIAVASSLEKMSQYVQGGPEFYSVAEGCQDNYLARLLSEAAKTGEKRVSQRQAWAN